MGVAALVAAVTVRFIVRAVDYAGVRIVLERLRIRGSVAEAD